MTQKKSVLGRGFETLLPNNFDQNLLLDKEERIHKIPIEKIRPYQNQPRTLFEEDAIRELAESIKEHGVLQPLIVTEDEDGKYTIIAGERRWRASKYAGLKTLPAVIRTLKELERLELALVENVQRVDLTLLEQATSIERLRKQFKLTSAQIAKKLGKSQGVVDNISRLLNLPGYAKEAIMNKEISEGHARQILSLKDYPDKQLLLFENIKRLGWSVRQAEQFVAGLKKGKKTGKNLEKHMAKETDETKVLSKKLAVPVTIRRLSNGGKLEISFNSDKQLNDLLQKLINNLY